MTAQEMMTYSHMTSDVLYLSLYLSGTLQLQEGGHQAFRALIYAAFFARAKLVSFQTNADLSFFNSAPERDKILKRAAKVFQNCEVFELELHRGDSSLLHTLLLALKLRNLNINLRRIKINYSDDRSFGFFKMIEVGCLWPCLEELRIRVFYI